MTEAIIHWVSGAIFGAGVLLFALGHAHHKYANEEYQKALALYKKIKVDP